jgi:hypothetical protein
MFNAYNLAGVDHSIMFQLNKKVKRVSELLFTLFISPTTFKWSTILPILPL